MRKILLLSFVTIFLFSCEKDDTEPETSPTTSNNSGGNASTAPTGIVSTLAGSTKGLANGIGTNAQFQFPYNIFSNNTHLFAIHPGNFSFITRRSPLIIRKVDLANDSVSTLITITDNFFDNANAAKAKAATLVPIGDSIYLGVSYRFYAININDGNSRSATLPSTTDSYGHLFLHNNRLLSIDNNTIFEINKSTGSKTNIFTIDPNTFTSNIDIQDISLIDDLLYISTHDNAANSDDYQLYSLNLNTQAVSLILSQSLAITYGYGFNQISNDGTDIYYMSDGRNSATYTFGKIDLSSSTNHLISDKNKGYMDGTLTDSEFDSPIGITFTNNNLYVFEAGNLKIRKVDFD